MDVATFLAAHLVDGVVGFFLVLMIVMAISSLFTDHVG